VRALGQEVVCAARVAGDLGGGGGPVVPGRQYRLGRDVEQDAIWAFSHAEMGRFYAVYGVLSHRRRFEYMVYLY